MPSEFDQATPDSHSATEDQLVFKGKYSDGHSAAVQPVVLALGINGIDIQLSPTQKPLHWPYSLLTSTLTLKQGDPVQIGAKSQPDARLFVEDGRMAYLIQRRAHHLNPAQATYTTIWPMIMFGIGVLSIAAFMWKQDFSPANYIAKAMPDEARVKLGKQVVNLLAPDKKICRQPEASKALAKLVARLQTGVGEKKPFHVRVARLPIINAFAAPGEQIIVTSKLLKFVKTPEELAGVIAHEMGHGLALHPETGLVRRLGVSTGINILFGGTAGGLGDLGSILLELKNTRVGEREADRFAIDILKGAEVDPVPFSTFFDKLEIMVAKKKNRRTGAGAPAQDKKENRFSRLLSSHPPLKERAEMVRAEKQWTSRQLLTSDEWMALANICKKKVDE